MCQSFEMRYVIFCNTRKQQDDRPPIKTCSRNFTEEWLTSHFQCRSEGETHCSEWSNEDTERIHNHFKDFPLCPDKATVMTHFESDSLRHMQYRLKPWDHLPRFCHGQIAVLICSFTSAKPRLTALKTSVSPRFFLVDLSCGERQDAVGFEYAIVCFVLQ